MIIICMYRVEVPLAGGKPKQCDESSAATLPDACSIHWTANFSLHNSFPSMKISSWPFPLCIRKFRVLEFHASCVGFEIDRSHSELTIRWGWLFRAWYFCLNHQKAKGFWMARVFRRTGHWIIWPTVEVWVIDFLFVLSNERRCLWISIF